MENNLNFGKYIDILRISNFKSFKDEEFKFNQHFTEIKGNYGNNHLLLAIRFVLGENINSLTISDWDELVEDSEKPTFVQANIVTELRKGFIFERRFYEGTESFSVNNQDYTYDLYLETLEKNGIRCKYLDLLSSSAFSVLDDPQKVRMIIEEISKSNEYKPFYDKYMEQIEASQLEIKSMRVDEKRLHQEIKNYKNNEKIADKFNRLLNDKEKLELENCILNCINNEIKIEELKPKLASLELDLECIPDSESGHDDLVSDLRTTFYAYQNSICENFKLLNNLNLASLDLSAAEVEHHDLIHRSDGQRKVLADFSQQSTTVQETIRIESQKINKRIQEIQKLNDIPTVLENNPEILAQYDEMRFKFEEEMASSLVRLEIQGDCSKSKNKLGQSKKQMEKIAKVALNVESLPIHQNEELLKEKEYLALLEYEFARKLEEIKKVKQQLEKNLASFPGTTDNDKIQLLKREIPGVIENGNSLVVDSDKTALKVIRFMKRKGFPTVECLPLSVIEGISPGGSLEHDQANDSDGPVTIGIGNEHNLLSQKRLVEIQDERTELLQTLYDLEIEYAKNLEMNGQAREILEMEIELEISNAINHHYDEDISNSDVQLEYSQMESELKAQTQKLNEMVEQGRNNLKTIKVEFQANWKRKLEIYQDVHIKKHAFRGILREFESIGKEMREKQSEYDDCANQLQEVISAKSLSLLCGVGNGLDLNEIVPSLNQALQKFEQTGGKGLYSFMKAIVKDSEPIDYQNLEENHPNMLEVQNYILENLYEIRELRMQMKEISVVMENNPERYETLKVEKHAIANALCEGNMLCKDLNRKFKLLKEERLNRFQSCSNQVALFMDEVYKMLCDDNINAFVRCEFKNPDEPYLDGVHFYGSMLCSDEKTKIVHQTLMNFAFLMARIWYMNCPILLMDSIEEDAIDSNCIRKIRKFFEEQKLFQIIETSNSKVDIADDNFLIFS